MVFVCLRCPRRGLMCVVVVGVCVVVVLRVLWVGCLCFSLLFSVEVCVMLAECLILVFVLFSVMGYCEFCWLGHVFGCGLFVFDVFNCVEGVLVSLV